VPPAEQRGGYRAGQHPARRERGPDPLHGQRYIRQRPRPGIKHIVYLDPVKYSDLGTLEEMRAVGRAVGRLNNLLPRRRFIS